MIKNIILSFLAICFLLLIITYLLNVNQIKLWNSPIIEGALGDPIPGIDSTIATQKSNISPLLLDNIDKTILLYDGVSGMTPENIVINLGNLNISDNVIESILMDKTMFDTERIDKISKYTETLRQNVSTEGLVMHYRFDNIEPDGRTIKNIASSANGKYDAIIHGKCALDKFDYKYGVSSMKFNYTMRYHDGKDNVSDYIEIPSIIPSFYDSDNNFQGFTFAVWYKTTNNSRGWSRLFEFAQGQFANHTILASCNFGTDFRYTFIICGPDGYEWNLAHTQQSLPIDTWVHVATTISDKGIYTNYINGVKTNSNYQKIVNKNPNATLNDALNSVVYETNPDTAALRVPQPADRGVNRIGKSVWYWGDAGFDGWMNDFRIYNKALQDKDITNIFNLQVKPIKYSFLQSSQSRLAINVSAKKDSVTLNADGSIKSINAGNNNKARLVGAPVQYCPKKQVILIPPSQFLEIPNNSNFGNNSFTVAMVINVKSFNPKSHTKTHFLLGSNGCFHFEMYIQNNLLYVNPSCRGGTVIHNFTNSVPNSINIFIIKVDTGNTIYCSVNGYPPTSINVGKYWGFNNIIRIGSTIDGYYSSETLEFYEFMVFNDFCDINKQQQIESYLSQNWKLDVLPTTHPFNNK